MPYQRPATRLPPASSASTSPAAAGWPRSAVNATVATSTEPKIEPSPTAAPTSTGTPGCSSAEPRRPRRADRVRRRLGAPLDGQREAADEREAVRGEQPGGRRDPVASTVTSTGPTTKMTSSTTDSQENAVGSSGVPASTCDQRARTSEPGWA